MTTTTTTVLSRKLDVMLDFLLRGETCLWMLLSRWKDSSSRAATDMTIDIGMVMNETQKE